MNRIWFGISVLVLLGNLSARAQNTHVPTEPRVLQRSHASVESTTYPRATPVATAPANTTHQSTPKTSTTRSFPSLNPKPDSTSGQRQRESGTRPFSGSLLTVGSSLAIVLGLFAGLVWVTRRFGAKSMNQGAIPNEVIQSLGSTPIDTRTNLTLVRCGTRILVLARTASGVQPISEITDPNEVRQITALCLGNSKKEFASMLQSIEKEPSPPGYVGAAETTTTRESRSRETARPRDQGRLFASA